MAEIVLVGRQSDGTQTKVTTGDVAAIDKILRSLGGNMRLEVAGGTQVEIESGVSLISLGGGAGLQGWDTLNGTTITEFVTKTGTTFLEHLGSPVTPPPLPPPGSGKWWTKAGSPTRPFFTGSDGVEKDLSAVGGGGSPAAIADVPGDPALVLGELVYFSAPNFVSKADATVPATHAQGVVIVVVAPGVFTIATNNVEVTAFAGLTPGLAVYLLPVPGGLDHLPAIPPGGVLQKVGVARDGDTVVFNLSPDYIEI